ncbi:MAG: manganese efflux pump [Anaerolineales bacterium]|uniref:Putative manganese efflux pump MntP n=1 Tax=Candidatus Desulfolinea nitratireducens TaxID=2841698 RepID=A0A8J6THC5_9CHLR|nr:manganese efflux pump [Candidatus Desulfolinea nitratireducens]MBL6959553.1 manganese efflux pump [Anaerolineales bacterium]
MTFLSIILIAISMAMDAFAISLGSGVKIGPGPRPIFRMAFHFGLFQGIMPIIGWLFGYSIEPYVKDFDHWVAFGLLAFVGLRMIRSGLSKTEEESLRDPSRGWTMVLLSVAVSIDALAIGLSLAFLNITIWTPALVIGLVTSGLSVVGLRVGNGVGNKYGKPVEVFGGLILIGIGIRIVISHLAG